MTARAIRPALRRPFFSSGVISALSRSACSSASTTPPHGPRRGSTTLSVMNQMIGVNSTTIPTMKYQLPSGFIVQSGEMIRAASWVKPNSSTSL